MTTIATSIVNDGNAAGTQIAETTAAGDTASSISLRNDGTLIIGDTANPGSISSDNNLFHTDGSGNVTAQNITVNGNLNVSGLATLAGLLLGSDTPITHFSTFTVTNASLSNTVSHGFGSIPKIILMQEAWYSSATFGFTGLVSNITSTQCTITFGLTSSPARTYNCIALG